MSWHTLWITLLALVLAGGASAQNRSPYQLSTGREIVLLGTGAATFGIGQVASARMDLLTVEQIETLDRNRVAPSFDQFALDQSSDFAKKISDIGGFGSTVVPLLLMLGDAPREDAGILALMYTEVVLLNGGITNLTKNTVRRTRPFVYNDGFELAPKRRKDARRSFFSGHTSNAAANSFFTAQAFSDFYPDSKARPWVWGGAILLPAITGTTRVLSGNHYWTDVLVGYAVGAGIGLLVPALHR